MVLVHADAPCVLDGFRLFMGLCAKPLVLWFSMEEVAQSCWFATKYEMESSFFFCDFVLFGWMLSSNLEATVLLCLEASRSTEHSVVQD